MQHWGLEGVEIFWVRTEFSAIGPEETLLSPGLRLRQVHVLLAKVLAYLQVNYSKIRRHEFSLELCSEF